MQPEIVSGFPLWAQIVVLAAVGLGVAIGAAYVYVRRNAPPAEKKEEAVVLSATLADSRAVRELIESIDRMRHAMSENQDQRHRDSIAERECTGKNITALRDLCEAVRRAPPPINPDYSSLVLRLDRIEREHKA